MTARRTTIRQLPLTEVVDRDAPGATPVSITGPEGGTIYHTAPLADPDTGKRRGARPKWIAGTFPLFPVVRLTDGEQDIGERAQHPRRHGDVARRS